MSIEESNAVVDRYTEAFNAAYITIFEEVCDPDVVDHNPPPHQAPGLDGIKQTFRMMSGAFPDSHVTVEDVIPEGDRVAVRMTIRGTHQG